MRFQLLPGLVLLLLNACSAAHPTNPSFPVTFAQARKALADMRSEPKPLSRPVVVIGGFLDLNISPPLYGVFLRSVSTPDAKIIPISVGLCGSFDECRSKVIAAVDAALPTDDPNFTAEVDVLGASLGGLVARYAAAPSPDAAHPRRLRIARLFTISSPHAGATLAECVGFTSYHRDMRPDSTFLQSLARSDATAGYELHAYVRLHDEIVGERYAAPPGATPWWLPNPPLTPSHLGAMIDDRILADIARRLRNEAPFTQSPAAPLPTGI
jgi:pimeloyl-ACP methyl ester carboxylesterase